MIKKVVAIREASTRTTDMIVDEEGILWITVKEDAFVEIADAIENFETSVQLAQWKRMLKLVDARHTFFMSPDAKKYSAEKETSEFNIARAVIVNSLPNKLMINFFIRFYKPKSPVKVFNDVEVALKWLREIKKSVAIT